ncbi:MAG: MBL fold metallo-hydrolase [Clostridia bacterium]|nr:MBL fold metallo-hydrolase [Clostridia bacterium]
MNEINICPGVIHTEESYRVYCTLVQGASLSVLADTGIGKTDLKPYAEKKFFSPYIVINTHGHADHVGGNRFFESAYISEADRHLAGPDAGRFDALVPGTVFDLGDDAARIVPLPGHTLGSCGILLKRRRLLIAGDALSPRLLFLGNEACSLDVLRSTLETALDFPFDFYLTSHAPALFDKTQPEAHLKHLDAFDPARLTKTRSAGANVWISRFSENGLRSEFVIGEELFGKL